MKVAYVLDASGSMDHRVRETVALTKKSIAKLDPNDRVSIYTFEGGRIRTVFKNTKASDVDFTDSDYEIGDDTNLLHAVYYAINDIKVRSPKETYYVVVLTDGGENHPAGVTKEQLAQTLLDLQQTDRWTFAWLVPPNCVNTTKALGIDESNILGWTDIKVADRALQQGQKNLATARAAGKTAVKVGFFADLSGTKKAEVRSTMTDVSAKVRRAVVRKREEIRDFCTREFGGYRRGDAMYELTEPETVQDYKEIALIDKRRPHEIFLGGRDILGLPKTGNVRLKPGDLGHYRAFVGSKSINRATDVGTEILYGDQIGIVGSALVQAR